MQNVNQTTTQQVPVNIDALFDNAISSPVSTPVETFSPEIEITTEPASPAPAAPVTSATVLEVGKSTDNLLSVESQNTLRNVMKNSRKKPSIKSPTILHKFLKDDAAALSPAVLGEIAANLGYEVKLVAIKKGDTAMSDILNAQNNGILAALESALVDMNTSVASEKKEKAEKKEKVEKTLPTAQLTPDIHIPINMSALEQLVAEPASVQVFEPVTERNVAE